MKVVNRMNKVLTGFNLKIIAIISMTIDHIGSILFPNLIILRIIGRIAFPIFAYLIAEGYFYTKNKYKYMLRLLIFAIISQVPYWLALGLSFNILFTFLLALSILKLEEILPRKIEFIPCSLFILSLAFFCDWSIFGVLYILAFYKFRENLNKQLASFIIISLIKFFFWQFINGLIIQNLIQLGVFLAIPFLFLYNGKRGRNLKYLFYIYYPLHIFVLWLLSI